MLPVTAPGEPAVGENVTLNCWVCPAAIVNGALGEIENLESLGVSVVIVRLVPTAVRVPVWDELTVPSGTEPKLRAD